MNYNIIMAKTLSDGRIQVEAGDTLWGIYGSNWKQASGYTGDPKRLPAGTILPAKATGSLEGTLGEKTLPEAPPSPPEASTKELPTDNYDQLSIFEDVLRRVTQRAAQEAKAKGLEAYPEGMLTDPSKISGGTFADVLNFATEEKTEGIADIYKATTKLVQDTRDGGVEQLGLLIDSGAIAEMEDEDLVRWAGISGQSVEALSSIRDIKKGEELTIQKYVEGMEGGYLEFSSIPSEVRSKVLAKVDWAKIPAGKMEVDEDAEELSRITDLLTDFGQRGYVSEGYYNEVKSSSSLSPTEFDNRFGYLVEGGEESGFAKAEQFVNDNPQASEESLLKELLKRKEELGLNSTDINTILDTRKVPTLSPEETQEKTRKELEEATRQLKGAGYTEKEALKYIEQTAKRDLAKEMGVSSDAVALPKYYQGFIKDAIKQTYSK